MGDPKAWHEEHMYFNRLLQLLQLLQHEVDATRSGDVQPYAFSGTGFLKPRFNRFQALIAAIANPNSTISSSLKIALSFANSSSLVA